MQVIDQPATRTEYRGRAAMLFLSQPVLAWLAWRIEGLEGSWYATPVPPAQAAAGLGLAIAGAWIRIQAASYFSSAKIASPNPMTDEIVQSGPFAVIRNPLYFGSWIWFLGFAVCFGWVPVIVFGLLHAWRNHRVVMLEEQLLRDEHPAAFEDYCRRVPRWIPRRPWALFFGSPWTAEAVLGNAPFLGLAIGLAVSLRTGTMLPVVVCEGLGFAVAGIHFLRRRRL